MADASPHTKGWVALAMLFVVGVWAWNTSGIVSSNDGSHLALARALALRGNPSIDPDWRLTFGVDMAQRGGHMYSDRPPGTAFLAIPSIWLGAQADATLFDRTRGEAPLFAPASRRIRTLYERRYPFAPPLDLYQGSALAAGIHSIILGIIGLCLLHGLLKRWGVAGPGRLFAVLGCGLCTLWGTYATALFSHGTSIACVAALVLALDVLRRDPEAGLRTGSAGGLAGALAVASEFSLLIVVPLAVLWLAPRRHWPALALGALPVAAATALYHDAAFGSPLAIGYQFQAYFDFAHQVGTTLGGDWVEGSWTLLGAGRGAGLLVLSPIVLAGLFALAGAPAAAPPASAPAPGAPDGVAARRWLIVLIPWIVLLCFHQTPWGGTPRDHRYLAPMLPLAGLGLGLAWQRWAANRWIAAALLGLSAYSCAAIWVRFAAWH